MTCRDKTHLHYILAYGTWPELSDVFYILYFRIVESCLYDNTLVTLPTGLGKTFIAAVVMYNYFRWFPLSKIVFMAPTKPLVQQQIEACFNIMGIPQIEVSDIMHTSTNKRRFVQQRLSGLQTMVMTGEVAIRIRRDAYKQKRVFFVTPQAGHHPHKTFEWGYP